MSALESSTAASGDGPGRLVSPCPNPDSNPDPDSNPNPDSTPSSSKSGEASPSSRKPEAEEAEAAAGLDEPPPADPAVVIGEAFRALVVGLADEVSALFTEATP